MFLSRCAQRKSTCGLMRRSKMDTRNNTAGVSDILCQEVEYCGTCNDYFPINEKGDILCECAKDPYLADSSKELNFHD